jgi:hypothetical protein
MLLNAPPYVDKYAHLRPKTVAQSRRTIDIANEHPDWSVEDVLALAAEPLPKPAPIPEPNLRPHGEPLSIEIRTDNLTRINCCRTATTALAQHPAYKSPVLLILPCKRWGCPVCSRQKIKALAQAVHAANPNRLMTLTVNPKLSENPELAWLDTRRKCPELFRTLRARGIRLEYLKITETTKKGFPHYHCLLRSDYIPQPVLRAAWKHLTGADIVDIRKITKHFAAFTYLMKYLTKLHSLEWTDRHVSYSRNFFPCPPSQTDYEADIQIKITSRLEDHPYAYLQRHFDGLTLTRLSPYRWLLDHQPNHNETTPDYTELGICVPTRLPVPEPTPAELF